MFIPLAGVTVALKGTSSGTLSDKKGTTEKPTIRFNTFYGLSYVENELKILRPERYMERRLRWCTINNIPAGRNKLL